MNKKIILLLTFIILLTACRKKEEPQAPAEKPAIKEEIKEQTNKINIKPGTFASKVILENIEDDKFDFNIDKTNNYSKIEQNDFDVAVIPGYLAPYYYNKTNGNIKVAAITSTGNLYLVSDQKINNQMDYKGKNFYIADLANNLDNIVENKLGPLNFVLRLNVEYYKNLDEIVEKMENSSNYVAILADPYYTRSLRKTQYVSSVDDILQMDEGDFISEVIIVNNNYLKNNEETFKDFLKSYKESSDKIGKNTRLSNDLLSTYDITEDEAKKALDRVNITYVNGQSMKEIYGKFIDQLYQLDKNIFSGDKPGDDFYYN
ncbi:hypothetical protein [Anaerococcus provencensis]|uniref:hypothetical protein n=1 Tax=Anaerococcus provencensis TaxID=938293 RepID=UPI00031D8A23|nr:hypothetical protein [Anaerococcus provencensis]